MGLPPLPPSAIARKMSNSDSKPRSSAHCAKSTVGMDKSVTTVTIPNFCTRLSLLVTEALLSSVRLQPSGRHPLLESQSGPTTTGPSEVVAPVLSVLSASSGRPEERDDDDRGLVVV